MISRARPRWLPHQEVLDCALHVGAGGLLVTADLHQLEVVPREEQSVRLLPVELRVLGLGASCLQQGGDHLP